MTKVLITGVGGFIGSAVPVNKVISHFAYAHLPYLLSHAPAV
jgi:hypothetical protein